MDSEVNINTVIDIYNLLVVVLALEGGGGELLYPNCPKWLNILGGDLGKGLRRPAYRRLLLK